MTSVLFWNVRKNDLGGLVAAIAKDLRIDIILLAEAHSDVERIRMALANEMPGVAFEVPTISLCRKILAFVRYSREFWRPVAEGPRFVIAELNFPARMRTLIAVAHLSSHRHNDERSISAECMQFASRIREAERRTDCRRTVVCGDFNLNPFDYGAVAATGLHGVMTKEVASRQARVINGEVFPFFYNPMWSRLGDQSVGPPGSYYYGSSRHLNYFWNTFDQVLVRPALLDEFSDSSLRLLTEVRGVSLMKNGRPNRAMYSDHLPLVFRLELQISVGE